MNLEIDRLAEKIANRFLPRAAARAVHSMVERRALARLEPQPSDVAALCSESDAPLRTWLSGDYESERAELSQLLQPMSFGTGSGAVNPGDRRALYYIVRALRPQSFLEVGTHVGGSTTALAFALKQQMRADPRARPRLVSVDLSDVNSPETGAWKRLGCSHSPRQLIEAIGCAAIVTFVTSASVPYLRGCNEKFDIIFLDGDHSSSGVYREIPLALRLLNPGGIILLHDYFPGGRPLWSDGALVAGPQLAVQRLRAEGLKINVIPFGALPWPTKLNSSISSLALACRSNA